MCLAVVFRFNMVTEKCQDLTRTENAVDKQLMYNRQINITPSTLCHLPKDLLIFFLVWNSKRFRLHKQTIRPLSSFVSAFNQSKSWTKMDCVCFHFARMKTVTNLLGRLVIYSYDARLVLWAILKIFNGLTGRRFKNTFQIIDSAFRTIPIIWWVSVPLFSSKPLNIENESLNFLCFGRPKW